MRARILVALAAMLASLTGCKRSRSAEDAGPDGGLGARWPTTSFSIAAGNLDVEIAGRTANDQGDPVQGLRLTELLLVRGQYLAKIEDYDRADAISVALTTNHPQSAVAHLARALAHGALHRFEQALHELDEAATATGGGVSRARVDGVRAGIFMTIGRYDDAAKLTPPVTEASSPLELANAAVLAARMQKPDEAERLFERARATSHDVSPFPLAGMDYQRATLLDARGRETEARAYYAEACDVIPLYVHAVVHLAATDPSDRAITRLEEVRKQSSDADLLAALATAHRKAGHDDAAKRLTEEARTRYDALVAKHPEAFWDHAARFWLGPGDDPKRAIELAEKNARLRPTEEALDLFMAAAAAADRPEKLCASAAAMAQLRWGSPERKRLANAALRACPDASPRED